MLTAVVSSGALGNLDDAMTLMSEVPKLVKMKNNQLEEFCAYRVIYSMSYLYTYRPPYPPLGLI